MKARLQGRVIKVVTAADVALLYTNWQGTMVEPSGETRRPRSDEREKGLSLP
jgi:hypothetical protein